MRLLVVSYFYPPIQNVASERWSRFVEHLKSQGHSVEVIAGPWKKNTDAIGGVWYLNDPLERQGSTISDVPFNPNSLTSKLKKFSPSFIAIDRKFLWAFNVVGKIRKLHADLKTRPELVIVTGSPWSGVFAVASICRLLNLPYGVDFRDYWANEPFQNFQGPAARKYFGILERAAVCHAKIIFTVNQKMADYFKRISADIAVTVLPHGYTGVANFSLSEFNKVENFDKTILYAGTSSNYHGVSEFFDAVWKIFNYQAMDHFTFMGIDAVGALNGYKVKKIPQGAALEAEAKMERAAVLLITLGAKAEHYTTGKLMTYLKMGRPILYFGPENSPAAEIIRQSEIGWVVDCKRPDTLKPVLTEIFRVFDENGEFKFSPDFEGLREYGAESVSQKLAQSIEGLQGSI